MKKVVITARLTGRVREILAGHEIVDPGEGGVFSTEELHAQLAEADALLTQLALRVDEELMARAPRLAIVANCAVGFDNIDLPAATKRHIAVTNTPGVLTAATADLAMTLILAAARRVIEGDQMIRAGKWQGFSPYGELGLDLDGATLGIVGLGRIGHAVAARARAFGMRVIHWQPRDNGMPGLVPLERLLEESDVVSIHCPLTPATRHLISARELGRMRPTAVLVNTARGAIVDENALVDALLLGRPGFAGLDVFENEPRVHPGLVTNPRVVLLPHIGSATRGTRVRMAETAAECIRERLDGRRPPNLVNPAAWPETIDS